MSWLGLVDGRLFLFLEHPEASQDEQNRGHGYDLVNDVFGGTTAQGAREAGWARGQSGMRGGMHLKPGFLCLFGSVIAVRSRASLSLNSESFTK